MARMMCSAFVTVAVVAVALSAFAASKTFEFKDLGIAFSWEQAARVEVRAANQDVVVEGSQNGVKLVIVARKGERVPRDQHEFRLASYFAGLWSRSGEDCRGQGWQECEAWRFDSERGNLQGLGLTGFGPSGTYFVLVTAPRARFEALRPRMRAIQDSLRLF